MIVSRTNREEGAPGAEAGVRVFLVDQQPITRYGLAQLIDKQEDLQLCGVGRDTSRCVEEISVARPQVAVVDFNLAEGAGLEWVKQLLASFPDLPILTLSSHDERVYADRAVRVGARGYVMKNAGTQDFLQAIRDVSSGKIYLSGGIASQVLNRMVGTDSAEPSPPSRLTDRQLEILTMIGQGLGTRRIAERLGRSVKTIQAHRENIKQRLNLGGASELTQYAVRWLMSESGR
ncbi:MAG: response regulator transcription factor [Phycisphaerae bacterium]|nr:response regulator transcription factor [Phycisphaerae bacterium]